METEWDEIAFLSQLCVFPTVHIDRYRSHETKALSSNKGLQTHTYVHTLSQCLNMCARRQGSPWWMSKWVSELLPAFRPSSPNEPLADHDGWSKSRSSIALEREANPERGKKGGGGFPGEWVVLRWWDGLIMGHGTRTSGACIKIPELKGLLLRRVKIPGHSQTSDNPLLVNWKHQTCSRDTSFPTSNELFATQNMIYHRRPGNSVLNFLKVPFHEGTNPRW